MLVNKKNERRQLAAAALLLLILAIGGLWLTEYRAGFLEQGGAYFNRSVKAVAKKNLVDDLKERFDNAQREIRSALDQIGNAIANAEKAFEQMGWLDVNKAKLFIGIGKLKGAQQALWRIRDGISVIQGILDNKKQLTVSDKNKISRQIDWVLKQTAIALSNLQYIHDHTEDEIKELCQKKNRTKEEREIIQKFQKLVNGIKRLEFFEKRLSAIKTSLLKREEGGGPPVNSLPPAALPPPPLPPAENQTAEPADDYLSSLMRRLSRFWEETKTQMEELKEAGRGLLEERGSFNIRLHLAQIALNGLSASIENNLPDIESAISIVIEIRRQLYNQKESPLRNLMIKRIERLYIELEKMKLALKAVLAQEKELLPVIDRILEAGRAPTAVENNIIQNKLQLIGGYLQIAWQSAFAIDFSLKLISGAVTKVPNLPLLFGIPKKNIAEIKSGLQTMAAQARYAREQLWQVMGIINQLAQSKF